MSTLAATHPTLLDLANMLDPGGNVADIAELLTQQNDILKDAAVQEGNLTTGNKTSIRIAKGSASWKKLYGYIAPDKSGYATVVDSCGMLRRYNEVDVDLAKLSGNVPKVLVSEAYGAIESMNDEMASSLFYANEATEPEAFTGLAPRYNSQSAENARNILTSAATPDSTDNTSIWLINWGPNVFLTYPKGSKAGLSQQDFGETTATDSNGALLQVYRSLFSWDVGLVVKDWRHIVRINFDLEDVIASGATGPVLYNLMAQAVRRIPNMSMGRPAFYMNSDALDMYDLQAMNKSTLAFKQILDAQGQVVDTFRGIPVRRCDAILSTEAGI